jgi:ATP-dependent helicase/nuclease subunit A
MQFCSFEGLLQNGASAELERLVREGFISRSTSELVNTYHLEKFRKSALLDELLRAKDIKREFRFNVMLDASEFTDDTSLKDEKILVQGVIDCLYENDKGEVVLVDYKTDFVTEDDCEKTLKERHSLQLSYYKRAIELMLERPLSKTLIYSVPLAKTVEI